MSNQQSPASHVAVPDGPKLRSVLIRAPSSFGIPSPRSLTASDRVQKTPPSLVAKPKQRAMWQLSKSQLRPLPAMYPLERSHIYVDDHVVEDVASRIAECLRKESISAVFNNDKAMVLAETPNHVRFCIRLFLDRDSVVVEVQRRSGCSFFFHQSAKAILLAAKGMKSTSLPSFDIPPSVVKSNKLKADVDDALEIATGLLARNRYDSHLLGMESLVQLTRSTTCRTAAAQSIFRKGSILDSVSSLVHSWRMNEDEDDAFPHMDEDYFAIMHRDALTVLANCLLALEATGELCDVLATKEELVSDDFLTVLIQELASAEQRPHDACQAARCLKVLLKSSESAKTRVIQLGVPEALTLAVNEGAFCHCMLEKESKQLQKEIDN